uniref:Uncharacterized protein n=1 Tax=Cacopsylla melanoneura TaxID=428564 RepID=A0A8D8W0A2_9HEMI
MTSTRSDPEKISSNERESRETHDKILKHFSTRIQESIQERQRMAYSKFIKRMRQIKNIQQEKSTAKRKSRIGTVSQSINTKSNERASREIDNKILKNHPSTRIQQSNQEKQRMAPYRKYI